MGYINALDRDQILLFPEVVDDYIADAHPVRFIDVSVDGLDLEALGFKYATHKETGRPPYQPGDLLKLYIYGYLNKIRSSRKEDGIVPYISKPQTSANSKLGLFGKEEFIYNPEKDGYRYPAGQE